MGFWNNLFKPWRNSSNPPKRLQFISFGGNTQGSFNYAPNYQYIPEVAAFLNRVGSDLSQVEFLHLTSKKEKIENSDIYYLLNIRPNELESATNFWKKAVAKLYLTGNVFILLQHNKNAKVKAMYVLETAQVSIVKSKNDKNKYRLIGKYLNSEDFNFAYDSVIHFRTNYSSGAYGTGLHQYLDKKITTMLAHEKTLLSQLQNSGKIFGVIIPGKDVNAATNAEDADLIRDNFVKEGGSRGVGVLPPGFDYKQLNYQYAALSGEDYKNLKDEIFGFWNVSQDLVNGKGNHKDIQAYHSQIVEPLANEIVKELNYKLLGFQNKLKTAELIKANTAKLKIGDLEQRALFIKSALETGALTGNEVRDTLDFPPHKDGDKIRVSLNNINAEIADKYQLKCGDNRLKPNKN